MQETLPYCYLIGWPELNKWYYGVKFSSGCHPDTFWITYFTSSSTVKAYRKAYGDPPVRQIRKIFNSIELETAQKEALDYERKVLKKLKIHKNEKFLNASCNVKMRTGLETEKHTESRWSRWGNYFTPEGLENMREHNREYTKLNNPMNCERAKKNHSEGIAKKLGYSSYEEYCANVIKHFEEIKTVKGVSDLTGHSQYAIRHLLFREKGKEWVNEMRKEGLKTARKKASESSRLSQKSKRPGKLNYNAYVWEAYGPVGEFEIIYGNRIQFCKDKQISQTLDKNKSHLRKGWEFKKICKIKDYD